MARCAGIKANGERCRGIGATGSDYCPAHDPSRQEARSRAASKAGRSRHGGEVRAVKAQLQELVDGLIAGEVPRSIAAVAGQLLNVKLRALALEREVLETEELEGRIGRLEQEARRRWPA